MDIERKIRFGKKTKASIVALGVVGAIYLGNYFLERRKITPIWKYRSHPPHPLDFDRYARIFLDPLMKVVADGMVTHDWDVTDQPIRNDYKGITIPSDSKARPRRNLLEAALAGSRIGWQRVFVMALDRTKPDPDLPDIWQIAFAPVGDNQGQKIMVGLPKEEQILMMVANQPYRFFALDLEGNGLPLIAQGPYYRRSPAVRGIRLF